MLASLAIWAPAMQMKTGKATGTCHWWLFVLGWSDHSFKKKTYVRWTVIVVATLVSLVSVRISSHTNNSFPQEIIPSLICSHFHLLSWDWKWRGILYHFHFICPVIMKLVALFLFCLPHKHETCSTISILSAM